MRSRKYLTNLWACFYPRTAQELRVGQETITKHKASDPLGAVRTLRLGWEIRNLLCYTITTISSRNMQP